HACYSSRSSSVVSSAASSVAHPSQLSFEPHEPWTKLFMPAAPLIPREETVCFPKGAQPSGHEGSRPFTALGAIHPLAEIQNSAPVRNGAPGKTLAERLSTAPVGIVCSRMAGIDEASGERS